MKTAHILLVEDNPGDILLTTEALKDRKFINKVSVTKNGKEALDFLFKRGDYQNAETPDLILLDINMPLLNGHEVLEEIKSNEETLKIPVIMLTTSSAQRDIDLSYEKHANCFITKPLDIVEFIEAISKIEDFWVQLVKLPVKE
jgi:CheY-like chemotaxis protein